MLPECQRWKNGRDSYRPGHEAINRAHYGVELLDEGDAKAFVERHHYSHSYVAARLRVGLIRQRPYEREQLVGAAVFSVPMNNAVIQKWAGVPPSEGVELGRFVLLNDVEANGETFFLSRAFRLLRRCKKDVSSVVAFSDPTPRRSSDGIEVKPGHVGLIYQAFSANYLGCNKPRTEWLARTGETVCARTLSKIRNLERGHDYAYETLRRLGAPARRLGEPTGKYVERALREGGFVKSRNPGKHVYTWKLGEENRLNHEKYPKEIAA